MRKLGLNVKHTALTIAFGVGFNILACSRAGSSEPVPKSATQSGAPSVNATTVTPTLPSASANATAATPLPPLASAAATATPAAAYDETTKVIEASLGTRFTLNLAANVTTPYKWVAAPSDESIVVLVDRHYQSKPPEGCQACVGYPGTDSLTFEAKAVGTTKLALRYAPIRSKTDPPQRELSIQVNVRSQ